MKLLVILLALLTTPALADGGTYLKVGVGLNSDPSSVRTLFVGYQRPLTQLLFYQLELGALKDNHDAYGIRVLTSASIGVSTVSSSGIYIKVFFGPSFLSHPDDRLSGHFQFNNDFELGIKGTNDISIGLNYKHISNAGIVMPNLGRDLLLIKIQLPY